jgi:hypothetical protein
METVFWARFAAEQPDLAVHVADRLARAPGYLATLRKDGWPRVHPVGPLALRDDHLVVGMYPTSPKAFDLRHRARYALHCGVEDMTGGGGEVLVTGGARSIEPTADDADNGYVMFELLIGEVLATRYQGDDWHPVRTRWP